MASNSIETLEIRVAYLDDSLARLSDTMYEHSRALSRLTQRCERMEARIDALMQGAEDPGHPDETPPHY